MPNESVESYRNLIAQVKDHAIFTTDPRGVITSWNEGCKNVLGYERDEFIGQHINMLFPPEAVASGEVDRELKTAAEKGSVSGDRWLMRRGGERFWASGITTGVRDAGSLMGFTRVLRDLTGHRQIEERLRRSEMYLRLLIESLPQLVWTCRADGECDYLSPQWVRYTGVPESKQLGSGWLNQLHPDDCEPTITTWNRAVKKLSFYDTEFRVRRMDGVYRWFKSRASPLRTEEGEVIKWFGTCTDIEDQKRVEALLRKSEERLRAERDFSDKTVDSLPGVFYLIDQQGRFLRWNKNLEEITGHSADDIARMTPLEFIVEEDRTAVERKIEEAFESGEANIEARLLAKGGRDIPYFLTGRRILIDGRPCLIGNGVDITERILAEDERERLLARERNARAEAEEANRLKDEFLATISHELRSPLNVILSWARLLRDPRTRGEQLDRALEIIERNAQAQTRLIGDLLDVSRIVSGKLSVQVRPVALDRTVEDVVADARASAEARGIDLSMKTSDREINLIGDSDRLQQVVWNLLSNAIKFTPDGGRIEVELKRVGAHVELKVSDTGRGISPEFLPHIFDRFRQANRTDAGARAGLGLGLTIVRFIAEAHGGSVTAESPGVGQGATFTVKLPLAAPTPEVVPAIERRELSLKAGALPSLSGVRVLVVDDDEDARDVLSVVLGSYGAEVTTAANAIQALDILAASQRNGDGLSVLVSDINMPGMDGYEFIRRVRAMERECDRKIPAVALTAYARAEDRVQALQAGYQMHVPKPIEPAELEVVVATLARSFNRSE